MIYSPQRGDTCLTLQTVLDLGYLYLLFTETYHKSQEEPMAHRILYLGLVALFLTLIFPDYAMTTTCNLYLSQTYESGGAGEFHPHAPTDPYVNLSIHTAPLIQPIDKSTLSYMNSSSHFWLTI